jgi:purine-binding chemotaxis protein CheW
MDVSESTQSLDRLWAEAQGEAGLVRFLTFKLHGQVYGISMDAVLEIIRAQRIRPMPGTPSFIRGVINLRGKVVPVVDARLRLGLPPKPRNERTCIVMTQCRGEVIGLIVDEVRDVLGLPDSRIERHVRQGSEHDGSIHFILGYGIVESQVRILLDIERLLFADWPPADAQTEP